jgi:hypothetical protein
MCAKSIPKIMYFTGYYPTLEKSGCDNQNGAIAIIPLLNVDKRLFLT